jgi:outer membrane protein assembly factor BamB
VLPVSPTQWPRSSIQLVAPPAISDTSPFRIAWSEHVAAEGPLALAFTASSLLLGGANVPLRALSIADGDLLWTANVGTDEAPALDGDLVLVVSGQRLSALDVSTGKARWDVPLDAHTQPATVRSGRVLVATGSEVRAYRLADGMVLWRQVVGAGAVGRIAASDSVAAVPLSDGVVTGLALETGEILWRTSVDGAPSGMTAAFGHLYFGTSTGRPRLCVRGE